jgi:hypothetical protein
VKFFRYAYHAHPPGRVFIATSCRLSKTDSREKAIAMSDKYYALAYRFWSVEQMLDLPILANMHPRLEEKVGILYGLHRLT